MTVFSPRGRFGRKLTQQIHLPTQAELIKELRQLIYLVIGLLLGTLGFVIFQVPHNFSAGGLTGVAIIVSHYTGLSHGMLYSVLSIPMIVLGFFMLGRWHFAIKSFIITIAFGSMVDFMMLYAPNVMDWPLTDNMMLNALYGGIVGGISGSFILWSGTTFPGSSVISRIINLRTGMPLATCYLLVDGGIIFATGALFGWESALYGFILLYVYGLVNDQVMDGPSTTRTVSIVTNSPENVSKALMASLDKGVSYWEITGGYTGEKHFMVMTTIFRSQVDQINEIVGRVDPKAFVTIGIGQKALGQGFKALPTT
ncbi:MAG: YitT family protein [Candidatus Promineifilaceae bacterium]